MLRILFFSGFLVPILIGLATPQPAIVYGSQAAKDEMNTPDNANLRLKATVVDEGIKVDCDFTQLPFPQIENAPEPIKVPFQVTIDGIIVHHGGYSHDSAVVSHIIPFDNLILPDGEHTLTVEVMLPSREPITKSVSFKSDSAPRISVELAEIHDGLLDATLTFSFPIPGKDETSRIEVYLDEQIQGSATVQTNNSAPLQLSKLLGQHICTSALPQGTHLLGIRAISSQGGATSEYASFAVENLSQLHIAREQNGKLKEIAVINSHCLESDEPFMGVITIHLDHMVLLEKQIHGDAVKVTLEEIEKVLAKYGHQAGGEKTAFVVALRSPSGAEHWQQVPLYAN